MDAEALLVRAGWFAGRRVDVADGLKALAGAGYAVAPAVLATLREFSGLVIASQDGTRQIWIDGERAAAVADPEWCRAYEASAGTPLVPVGGYSHMIVLADGEGSLWGGFDEEFGTLADSVEELVDVVLVSPGSVRLNRRVD